MRAGSRPPSTPRPRLDLPPSPLESGLYVAALAAWLTMVGLVASAWQELPEVIPTHFSWDGDIDGWGGKWTLWLLPVVAAVLPAGLFFLRRFPHLYNYPWAITEENAERQYRLARFLLASLAFAITALFLVVALEITSAAQTGVASGPGPVLAGLAAVFGAVGFYLYAAYRAR